MKILMTGGSGLLGKEILKIDSSIYYPTHKQMDVKDINDIKHWVRYINPDTILHLAANTDCQAHEHSPHLAMDNIIGSVNVAIACIDYNVRLVYTSTDYIYYGEGPHKETEAIFPPYNFAKGKLGGEMAVSLCPNSLILRLSFGRRPFPHQRVYEGQYNSKLYVDEMAPLVLKAAKSSSVGIMNIGGQRNSLEQYARRSRPDIETIPCPAWVPKDTSLDITRMESEL